MSGYDQPRSRVLLLTDEPALEQLVRELIATILPSISIDVSTPSDAPLTPADAAIIDQTVRALPGFTVAQELRARGFRGGLAIIDSGASPELAQRVLTVAPSRVVRRSDIVTGLPRALVDLVARPEPDGELAPVERNLRRVQQLIAMGEVTSRIQHTLNNPLTALLAEAQLLEMEPLDAEQLASVRRIIDQCRRVVAMVRGLETSRSE
jgi:signal transduction histidine kinase